MWFMKMRCNKSALFLLLINLINALFFSCKQESSIGEKSAAQKFYNLKDYFDAETHRLNSKGRATKIVTADGKTEEKVIDNIDFKRELDFFAGSDINRPAWSDKYVVDTMFNEHKEITRLHYKCLDEKLKARTIIIGFDKSEVTRIRIENNTSNSIATSSQVLIYQPSIGYSIESHQEVAIGVEQLFKVEVRF